VKLARPHADDTNDAEYAVHETSNFLHWHKRMQKYEKMLPWSTSTKHCKWTPRHSTTTYKMHYTDLNYLQQNERRISDNKSI